MPQIAKGSFDVKMDPAEAGGADARFILNKTYDGDLEATGIGEMLTGMGEKDGSAAYVAIEQVTGRLNGRVGSFKLVHRGVMSPAGQELLITVVPDSGTGELVGLSGALAINIDDGQHYYTLTYSQPNPD